MILCTLYEGCQSGELERGPVVESPNPATRLAWPREVFPKPVEGSCQKSHPLEKLKDFCLSLGTF
jgi:hypothetical protein